VLRTLERLHGQRLVSFLKSAVEIGLLLRVRLLLQLVGERRMTAAPVAGSRESGISLIELLHPGESRLGVRGNALYLASGLVLAESRSSAARDVGPLSLGLRPSRPAFPAYNLRLRNRPATDASGNIRPYATSREIGTTLLALARWPSFVLVHPMGKHPQSSSCAWHWQRLVGGVRSDCFLWSSSSSSMKPRTRRP